MRGNHLVREARKRAGLTQAELAARVGTTQSSIARFVAATGSPTSPTPTGNYFVTDRVAFPRTSPYGSFAFGISGIQPRLPSGWSGGDLLAIHGTNDPASIGKSVSTGCLRVGERALARLKLLLVRGTPVVIER